MGQLQARSVHSKATKMFSQYDTSAIQPKKGPGKKIAGIVIAVVVVILVVLVATGVIGPFASPTKTGIVAGQNVEVKIPTGSSTSDISKLLYDNDVIDNEGNFKRVVSSHNADSSLKPGTYELTTLMDIDELVDTLVSGPDFYGTRLTIPEGLTVSETASIVESTLGISATDFVNAANSASTYAADYPFLSGVYNNSLEGYLFPKTYDVPDGATADSVIRMMLDQFQTELKQAGISTEGGKGVTLSEIVNVASMIQKETADTDEMSDVASVIYNRLNSGMALQIDATVVYALGSSYTGGSVTYDDLQIDSPYNTYKNTGLPAGPICSPGADALKAAANPSSTNYLYYLVTDSSTGKHSFFDNYDAFLAAKGSRQ